MKKSAPIIRLEDVHKAFNGNVVLSGVNLEIYPRQTTVIIGPSGCGKSVLLRHIVGLL
ncbi:MAG: ATP-binding cassette domain-containing protein, partial [Phycisphaerae bacterium]|nr:ATP-binding cassette domain-containing protein [Phycisphaerae bacterium]